MEQLPNITKYFSGRDIFITGGSGFLGKVLIEKLLRTCPDIGNIYILLRIKKGKSVEERIQSITEFECFDRLKEEYSDGILKKIIPVDGDISELGLGLSDEHKSWLIENVSVVFHSAATIRFDESLKDAILLNTRGTREVVKLALQMKNIAVLAHISTAYSNCDRVFIEECLYPPLADWRKTIEIAENMDHYTLDILRAKYIGRLPNTYTFTKHLAEHVVKDMCQDKIPVCLLRPSIVTSSHSEPFPGWCDNFNGSIALVAAVSLGIVKCLYGRPEVQLDNVPVDICIKAIITAVWVSATDKCNKNHLRIYNICSVVLGRTDEGSAIIVRNAKLFPPEKQIWYPSLVITTCKYNYYLRIFLFQFLPAFLLDRIIQLWGGVPILLKLQRKAFISNLTVEYFIFTPFLMVNENFLALEKQLLEEDKAYFGYRLNEITLEKYLRQSIIGGRIYLLKEKPENINLHNDFQRALSMKFRYYFINTLICIILFWTFVVKLNIFGYLFDKIENTFSY